MRVWVCACVYWLSTLLARPFASILSGCWCRGGCDEVAIWGGFDGGDGGAGVSWGGFGSFPSWPGAASRALPAKRMQMSASHKGAHSCTQPAKDGGTRRPSLSSVTSDPLSMTRRVHTNMPHPHPHSCQGAMSLAATSPPTPTTPGCPLPADDALARRLSCWRRRGCGLHACSDSDFLPTHRAG